MVFIRFLIEIFDFSRDFRTWSWWVFIAFFFFFFIQFIGGNSLLWCVLKISLIRNFKLNIRKFQNFAHNTVKVWIPSLSVVRFLFWKALLIGAWKQPLIIHKSLQNVLYIGLFQEFKEIQWLEIYVYVWVRSGVKAIYKDKKSPENVGRCRRNTSKYRKRGSIIYVNLFISIHLSVNDRPSEQYVKLVGNIIFANKIIATAV